MTYEANEDGTLTYTGNEVFDPRENVSAEDALDRVLERPQQFQSEEHWQHIAEVNDHIFNGVVDYFDSLGAQFTLLPLTTRLISSPGAVFGSETIDYTEDTSPIKLEWFDRDQSVFLSESSQIYLELSLIQQELDHVYSVYNSFRKEEADATHLSEFHHIEYEGTVDQERNKEIVVELLQSILDELLTEGREDLEHFLTDDEIVDLYELRNDPIRTVTFERALELLREDTGDEKYEEFTEEHFDDWEEVRLTELFDHKIVCLEEFPLLEVPFYHAEKDGDGDHRVAKNSDFLWPGYKETVGTGERVADVPAVEEKADVFNLPEEDYQPYIDARKFDTYERTSGFGIGWERLLQGVLQMPTIISVTHFPRVHTTIKP